MRVHSRLVSRRAPVVVVAGALAALTACPPADDAAEGEGEGEPARTTFSWEKRDDINVPGLWGAIVADGPSIDEAFVVGGVSGDLGPVIKDIQQVHVQNDQVRSSSTLTTDVPRFCGCALFDKTRNEVVVVGGRDGSFLDVESAVVIDVDSGERSVISEGAGPTLSPIGCQAFFVDSLDKGYVFSGLSSNRGEFGTTLFEYDGAARTFTALDVADGPEARYDASVHLVDDDSFLMVGGMGLGARGPIFFSDVWRFDADTKTWTEIATTTDAPAGRRYPWAALNVDEDTLLYGYGSDSPTGETLLGDLWRFTLSTGVWEEITVDGDAPSDRGFAYRLPGISGTAGTLVGGIVDGMIAAPDAFVLRVPDDLQGTWR